jgi:hypothetical protein
MTDYGLHLLPQHRAMLAASAITPEVVTARGYFSVHTKADLERKGFAKSQRTVPGLLIPVHATDGTVRLYQYRPDTPRTTKDGKEVKYETPYRAAICLDVPPAARPALTDPAVPLWITEGARKADAAVSAGLCCISLFGVDGWQRYGVALPDWSDVLIRDREVVICFDSDVMTKKSVAAALAKLTGWLDYRGAKVRHVILPAGMGDDKVGLDDFLSVYPVAELAGLVRAPAVSQATLRGDTNTSGKPPEKPVPDVPAMTIAQVENVYARWLHDGDKVTTRVVHAVYVANMVLPGDPVWMMLVGGSGQGKTERIAPLAIMPHVELASTLSGDAALLSATSRRDRAEHAHGGLLRRIGDKGILVIKDFTSILEMDRTARGQVLAALREVYDGRWDREVGTDGGQTLKWAGKCGLLAGTTAAIDRAYGVMNDMGPRSLFLRLPAAKLDKVAGSALDHMGRESTMRAELAAATAGLLTHLPGRPHEISGEVRDGLIGLASLVSQARSPVHRDYKGEIELVGDAEAPTRIIKQLGQIWRACGLLGLGQDSSWEVVRRCALDSIPKLRGAVIRYLAQLDAQADTTTIGTGVVHPTRTVRRALEDLAAHGVLNRQSAGQGRADNWELSDLAKGWIKTTGTLPETLESQPKPCTKCGEPLDQALIDAGFTDHGEPATSRSRPDQPAPACGHCDGTGHCPLPACRRCGHTGAGGDCTGCNSTGSRPAGGWPAGSIGGEADQ